MNKILGIPTMDVKLVFKKFFWTVFIVLEVILYVGCVCCTKSIAASQPDSDLIRLQVRVQYFFVYFVFLLHNFRSRLKLVLNQCVQLLVCCRKRFSFFHKTLLVSRVFFLFSLVLGLANRFIHLYYELLNLFVLSLHKVNCLLDL